MIYDLNKDSLGPFHSYLLTYVYWVWCCDHILEMCLLRSSPSMMGPQFHRPLPTWLMRITGPGIYSPSPPEMPVSLPSGLWSNSTPYPCLCLELWTLYSNLVSQAWWPVRGIWERDGSVDSVLLTNPLSELCPRSPWLWVTVGSEQAGPVNKPWGGKAANDSC